MAKKKAFQSIKNSIKRLNNVGKYKKNLLNIKTKGKFNNNGGIAYGNNVQIIPVSVPPPEIIASQVSDAINAGCSVINPALSDANAAECSHSRSTNLLDANTAKGSDVFSTTLSEVISTAVSDIISTAETFENLCSVEPTSSVLGTGVHTSPDPNSNADTIGSAIPTTSQKWEKPVRRGNLSPAPPISGKKHGGRNINNLHVIETKSSKKDNSPLLTLEKKSKNTSPNDVPTRIENNEKDYDEISDSPLLGDADEWENVSDEPLDEEYYDDISDEEKFETSPARTCFLIGYRQYKKMPLASKSRNFFKPKYYTISRVKHMTKFVKDVVEIEDSIEVEDDPLETDNTVFRSEDTKNSAIVEGVEDLSDGEEFLNLIEEVHVATIDLTEDNTVDVPDAPSDVADDAPVTTASTASSSDVTNILDDAIKDSFKTSEVITITETDENSIEICEESIGNKSELSQGKITLQDEIDNSKESHLGLEYLVEIWEKLGSELKNFVCMLCDETLNKNDVLKHVTGSPHRVAFVEKHFPSYTVKFSPQRGEKALQEFCGVIEKQCGRLLPHIASHDLYVNSFSWLKDSVINSGHFEETDVLFGASNCGNLDNDSFQILKRTINRVVQDMEDNPEVLVIDICSDSEPETVQSSAEKVDKIPGIKDSTELEKSSTVEYRVFEGPMPLEDMEHDGAVNDPKVSLFKKPKSLTKKRSLRKFKTFNFASNEPLHVLQAYKKYKEFKVKEFSQSDNVEKLKSGGTLEKKSLQSERKPNMQQEEFGKRKTCAHGKVIHPHSQKSFKKSLHQKFHHLKGSSFHFMKVKNQGENATKRLEPIRGKKDGRIECEDRWNDPKSNRKNAHEFFQKKLHVKESKFDVNTQPKPRRANNKNRIDDSEIKLFESDVKHVHQPSHSSVHKNTSARDHVHKQFEKSGETDPKKDASKHWRSRVHPHHSNSPVVIDIASKESSTDRDSNNSRRYRRPISPTKKHSLTPVKSQSPIPLRRRHDHRKKHSPSPVWKRAPSPVRRRTRSPLRRLTRSPVRRRTRSPVRRHSRSPVRRRSRSPVRRHSRSPVRRHSPSPVRKRSRSPVRRHSRSPVRQRSRSAERKRSNKSPSHNVNRSVSPVIRGLVRHSRRVSRSPIRRRRESSSPERNISTDRYRHHQRVTPSPLRRNRDGRKRSSSRTRLDDSPNTVLFKTLRMTPPTHRIAYSPTSRSPSPRVKQRGSPYDLDTKRRQSHSPSPRRGIRRNRRSRTISLSPSPRSFSPDDSRDYKFNFSGAPDQYPNRDPLGAQFNGNDNQNVNFRPIGNTPFVPPVTPSVLQLLNFESQQHKQPPLFNQLMGLQFNPNDPMACHPQSVPPVSQPLGFSNSGAQPQQSVPIPFLHSAGFGSSQGTIPGLEFADASTPYYPPKQVPSPKVMHKESLFQDMRNTVSKIFGVSDPNTAKQESPQISSVKTDAQKFFSHMNPSYTATADSKDHLFMKTMEEIQKDHSKKELLKQAVLNMFPDEVIKSSQGIQPPATVAYPPVGNTRTSSNEFTQQPPPKMPPLSAKVQFKEITVLPSAGNIFPIVKRDVRQTPPLTYPVNSAHYGNQNVTLPNESAQSLIAQKLASILIKLGMVDVPGTLLSDMLQKINIYRKSHAAQDVNENEILYVLEKCGFIRSR